MYRSWRAFVRDAQHNHLLLIPAALYAVNNYLKFLMQLYFRPTTAKMLSNLKAWRGKGRVAEAWRGWSGQLGSPCCISCVAGVAAGCRRPVFFPGRLGLSAVARLRHPPVCRFW
jgi:hypothetical protein